jgi:hypothetical protein
MEHANANTLSNWMATTTEKTIDALHDPLRAASDWEASARVVLWMALGMFLVYHPLMLMCEPRIRAALWWPKSMSAQRSLMMDFGFSDHIPDWDVYTVSWIQALYHKCPLIHDEHAIACLQATCTSIATMDFGFSDHMPN